MHIAGWQKVSLVDYPGKVACTLFTGGCNLRCPYCHNSELLEGEMPSQDMEEVMAYLDARKGILDGVVISGGEPCLQSDLVPFLARLKEKGLLVKLDTNGCFPARLEKILDAHLVDYVAMDWKNDPDHYALTAGVEESPLAAVTRSLEALLSGTVPFELRTTVVEQLHGKRSFEKIRDYLLPLTGKNGKKIPAFYLQAFKDRDTGPFAGLTAPDKKALEQYGALLEPIADTVRLRGV